MPAGTHLDICNFKAELMQLESVDGWQYSFVYHAQNGINVFCSSKMNP